MAHCANSFSGKAMHQDRYDVHCVDDPDEDEDDLDDDDVDGYDGLSDYDEEDVRPRGYARHSFTSVDDGPNGGDVRRQRSVSEGSMTLLEPGEDNRRDHHNQLERKRRASIKTSYNDLREAIPSLRGSKASRAVILQRAVECIEELVKLNRDRTYCVDTLKRQNDFLDLRVQELQRLVQRMEGEEACNLTSANSCINDGNPGGSVALRLIPGSCSNQTGSGIPMYRYMPQDGTGSSLAVSDSLVTTGVLSEVDHGTSSTPNSQGHTQKSMFSVSSGNIQTSATYPAPVLNRPVTTIPFASNVDNGAAKEAHGLNNAGLVISAHSAFSPSVPSSDGSSNCPTRSLSQRSSPSDMSSSSSNVSYNQVSRRSHPLEDDIVPQIQQGTACDGSSESMCTSLDSAAHVSITSNLTQKSITSSPIRSSSPPSIVSSVPPSRKCVSPTNLPSESDPTSLNVSSEFSGRPKRRKYK